MTIPKHDSIRPTPALQPAPIDSRFAPGPYGDYTLPIEPYGQAPYDAAGQYPTQQPNHHPYSAKQDPAWGSPQGSYAPSNGFSHSTSVNVTMNAMAPTIVMAPGNDGPSLIVRAIWYIFIGFWLSGLTIVIAYLLCATIIGIPVAFALFNKLPQITTMKARTKNWTTDHRDGVTFLTTRHAEQRGMLSRGIYFVCFGLWAGAVWLSAAYILQLLLITLPVALWMYDRAPAVMTLHRH